MSFGELWSAIQPYLVTALSSGGAVAVAFKWWLDRREKREQADAQERSAAAREQTLDRQKLTDEIYRLYRDAEAAEALARKEMREKDRELDRKDDQIAEQRRQIEQLKFEQRNDRLFQTDQDKDIRRLNEKAKRLERDIEALERQLARPPYSMGEEQIKALREPEPKLRDEYEE